jgi:hypothetical protein
MNKGLEPQGVNVELWKSESAILAKNRVMTEERRAGG